MHSLAISLNRVVRDFGRVRALDHLDLDVPAGSVAVLLGPNGAGKTTTVRVITGALRAHEGTVRILGRDPIADGTELRRRIGVVPPKPALYDQLDGWDNLFTVGRNGQHRYNNQDHSMLAGLFAARNVAGAELDLWSINEELSFHEEVGRDEAKARGVSDRLTPTRIDGESKELLQTAFSTYDEVALGGAVGVTASIVLAVATVVLLLGPSEGFVPMLSLLGNYLFGYEVSFPGMAVGMVEAGLIGFVLGWIAARLINRLTSAFERDLERRLAALTTLEALDGGKVERS
jgi:ABC-type Fe3+/spermidine/putrescine transport system ATPase subunit